jgi:MFS family permease
MAALKDKVKTALQENRILVLATQVVLGLQFRSTFEQGFTQLPEATQHLKLVALGLMLLAFALLLTPSSFHRLVERGEDTHRLHHLLSRMLKPVLVLFAVVVGMDLFVAAEKVAGRTAGLGLGVGGVVVGLGLFYGFTEVQRYRRAAEIDRRKAMSRQEEKPGEKVSVKDKIDHVLMESRMVLPGAQALLGFQIAIILQETFDKLPHSSKLIHLVSLACVALSILLLMTPSAYHRIVEQGEETDHFHKVASRLLVVATLPLALGLTGDTFVVVRKVLDSVPAALVAAGANLLLCLGLWFGFTLVQRKRHPEERGERTGGSRRPAHA